MWKVTADYRQGREVKDDKNRKREKGRAWLGKTT
jgi:hypothetical protein